MKPILIDCDPGIDDAVAILYALRSGELDLRAITTVSGNLTADLCASNANCILDLAEAPQIPVSQGPLKPLVRPYPRDPFSHGSDGLGELALPASSRAIDPRFAADLILETADACAGKLTLLALGPLTNIALALIKDPTLPKRVRELILIGGAYGFHTAGATRATGDNPASEWNIYVDPEAAQIVFSAGFELTALGLDVATHPDVELTAAHHKTLSRASTPESKFLRGVVGFVERRGFRAYCGLIDSLAVAVAIDPALVGTEAVNVAIETCSDLTRGQTIVDRRDHFRWDHLPSIRAANRVDATRFVDGVVSTLTRARAV